MKPNAFTHLLAALFVGALSLPAQDTTTDERLARALQRYPDADADKDGKLSFEEARAYLETHPELKAKFGGKLRASGTPNPAAPRHRLLRPSARGRRRIALVLPKFGGSKQLWKRRPMTHDHHWAA